MEKVSAWGKVWDLEAAEPVAVDFGKEQKAESRKQKATAERAVSGAR